MACEVGTAIDVITGRVAAVRAGGRADEMAATEWLPLVLTGLDLDVDDLLHHASEEALGIFKPFGFDVDDEVRVEVLNALMTAWVYGSLTGVQVGVVRQRESAPRTGPSPRGSDDEMPAAPAATRWLPPSSVPRRALRLPVPAFDPREYDGA